MAETITIKGTFDIARTRNSIRKIADTNGWKPLFRARSAAVLTAIAEMVLFSQHTYQASLNLKIDVVDFDGHKGLVFHCETSLIADDPTNATRLQLARLSDDLEITPHNGGSRMTVVLWAN